MILAVAMPTVATFVRKPDILETVIDDEVVMMDVTQGQYFNIKGVGTRIWDLLKQPSTIESIVQAVRLEYDVEESQCRSDVNGFVSDLEGPGLVVRS